MGALGAEQAACLPSYLVYMTKRKRDDSNPRTVASSSTRIQIPDGGPKFVDGFAHDVVRCVICNILH